MRSATRFDEWIGLFCVSCSSYWRMRFREADSKKPLAWQTFRVVFRNFWATHTPVVNVCIPQSVGLAP